MRNFVIKYPAISLLILSMVLGGVMLTPIIIGMVPSDSIFLLIAAYSCSLSGVILIAIVSGKDGLRDMLKRLFIWRAAFGWWFFALFAVLPMYFIGMYLSHLFASTALSYNLVQPLYMFIPLFIMKFFMDAGLGEELAWRGFLLPRLQARYNALIASIIVGIVWGLWHLPLFMLDGMPTYEMGQLFGVVPALIGHTLLITIPWAILFTWMYNNTKGSLLLMFVFHSSQAWFNLFIDPENMIGPFIGYSAIMVLLALVVVLISGAENLSRTNNRIMIHDA